MEELDKVIDDIGIETAIQQIEDFFALKEEQRKQRAIQQYEQTLAEQRVMRHRWKNNQCT